MRVKLRPLRLADAATAARWVADEEFRLANGWRPGLTHRQLQAWLRETIHGRQTDLLRLGIQVEGELVGYVDLAT